MKNLWTKWTGYFHYLRKTSCPSGRLHAFHLLCNQSHSGLLVHPSESLSADPALPEEKCHHSLLLIPMACSLFGISDDISMQVVAVGFIIGVIQDSVETALNSSSDLLLSASAEFRQWRLEGKKITF